MAFKVFVGYGTSQGKTIAEKLGHYLIRKGFDAFVASTDPRWLFGQPLSVIYDELVASDIFVPVCTPNATTSQHLRDEICTCLSVDIPILVFRMDEVTVPPELIPRWHIKFKPTRPWSMHQRINDILPKLIEWHRENIRNVKSPIIQGSE